jgi:predicted nucleic acid-binding protein
VRPRRVGVVDANVLYSIELTDLLVTLAVHRLVRLHWSESILAEVRRNLARRDDLDSAAIEYRIERMNRALPGALDEAPGPLIDSMQIVEHDRHVLALAVHVEADSIITFNLRDFPNEKCEPYGIEAIHPDAFTTMILDAEPAAVAAALAAIAARRARPTMTVDALLDRLSASLPTFVDHARTGTEGAN